MKFLSKVGIALSSMVPFLALAQQEDAIDVATKITQGIGTLVKTAIPVVFGLAILAFFWGIARYVFSQSTEDKKDGRSIMLWALIAVFIMVSLYGIIALLQQTFGITTPQGGGVFEIPTVTQGGQ